MKSVNLKKPKSLNLFMGKSTLGVRIVRNTTFVGKIQRIPMLQ